MDKATFHPNQNCLWSMDPRSSRIERIRLSARGIYPRHLLALKNASDAKSDALHLRTPWVHGVEVNTIAMIVSIQKKIWNPLAEICSWTKNQWKPMHHTMSPQIIMHGVYHPQVSLLEARKLGAHFSRACLLKTYWPSPWQNLLALWKYVSRWLQTLYVAIYYTWSWTLPIFHLDTLPHIGNESMCC